MERRQKIQKTLEEIFSRTDFQTKIKSKSSNKDVWSQAIDYAVIMEDYDKNSFEKYMNINLKDKDAVADFWITYMAQKLSINDLTQDNRLRNL